MGRSAEDFQRLVDNYSRVMSGAIRRVCGRRHGLIPDIEQEVRLALWKRLQDGNEIEHPVSYLYKMALTTALAVLRRQPPEDLRVGVEALELDAPRSGGFRKLDAPERARLIEQLLDRLRPDQARAMRAYLAGFNHREVAALYGWTEPVARHHIYRGLELLRTIEGGTDRHE